MAFPVDAARTTTQGTSAVNKVYNLPSDVTGDPGEFLVLLCRVAQADTMSTPSGWVALVLNSAADGSGDTMSIFYRDTDASDVGVTTVTVNGTAALKFSGTCWRITGGNTPEVSSIATGNDDLPDPPSFSPSGGAKDYLWIWTGGWEGEQTNPPTGNPTNYSNPVGGSGETAGALTGNCRTAGATRQNNTATEDPPSWQISASDQWSAWTVAVPPAAAAFSDYEILGRPYGRSGERQMQQLLSM